MLVTGAGGSIGTQLSHKINDLGPQSLHILDRSEYGLFSLDRALPTIAGVHLVDVQQADLVTRAIERAQPDVIFHAAAYKHVPLLEQFPLQAVQNNVIGTQHVLEAAARMGAETVCISTDKAVAPASIMGATKYVCERLIEQRFEGARAIRLCNVLSSSGSVIEIFLDAIARKMPLPITHADATRYIMLPREGAEAAIWCAGHGPSGATYTLEMARATSIVSIARALLRSVRPTDPFEMRVTGLRAGERVHEALYDGQTERMEQSEGPVCQVTQRAPLSTVAFDEAYSALVDAARAFDERETVRALRLLCPSLPQG